LHPRAQILTQFTLCTGFTMLHVASGLALVLGVAAAHVTGAREAGAVGGFMMMKATSPGDRVLVAGATGRTGRRIVESLLSRGRAVTAGTYPHADSGRTSCVH
jgi:hypothetical protein